MYPINLCIGVLARADRHGLPGRTGGLLSWLINKGPLDTRPAGSLSAYGKRSQEGGKSDNSLRGCPGMLVSCSRQVSSSHARSTSRKLRRHSHIDQPVSGGSRLSHGLRGHRSLVPIWHSGPFFFLPLHMQVSSARARHIEGRDAQPPMGMGMLSIAKSTSNTGLVPLPWGGEGAGHQAGTLGRLAARIRGT